MKEYKDKKWLYEKYILENWSINKISDFLNVNPSTIMRWIKKHDLKKDISLQKEARENTCQDKFGVKNVFQDSKIKDKIKETNFEKYGSEYYLSSEAAKNKINNIIFEKYQVKYPFQNEKIKAKAKRTMLLKYGAETTFQSKVLFDKVKITNNKKYNVDFVGSSKEIQYKVKSTLNLKWNGHYMKNDLFLKELAEKRNSVLIDNIPAYTYAKKENFPSSLLYKLINSSYNSEDIKKIIDSWDNTSNITSIEKIIEKNFPFAKRFNKKLSFTNARPDFKILDNLYLNTDGLYWHSELKKNKFYHYNLRKEFEENNIQIMQFREDEIINKLDIISSMLKNKLKLLNNKIYARKTTVKFVDQKTASLFLNANHMMGDIKAKHIGLYNNNDLISLLSYREFSNYIKVDRFCSLKDFVVIGGLTKLLSKINLNKDIHYWVDLRYGTGNNLVKFGFKHIKDTLGWKWVNVSKGITYNRLQCRANMDKRNLSEKEYAEELGWVKIYDAGQRLWVKEKIK